MGTTENLMGIEAVNKVKDLAKDEIALLCTFEGERLSSRPMGTQGIDDDGVIWFMSGRDSTKNRQIAADPRVHLFYSNHSKLAYLSLEGTASIVRDQKKIDELWTPLAKTWFTEGKDDPRVTLIRFVPATGHYWDTKHSKMITMATIAIGAVTGKTIDDGREGSLKP